MTAGRHQSLQRATPIQHFPTDGGFRYIDPESGRLSDFHPYDVSPTEEKLIWAATYARWTREDKATRRARWRDWVGRAWESWEFHILLVLLVIVAFVAYAIVEASLLPHRISGRG